MCVCVCCVCHFWQGLSKIPAEDLADHVAKMLYFESDNVFLPSEELQAKLASKRIGAKPAFIKLLSKAILSDPATYKDLCECCKSLKVRHAPTALECRSVGAGEVGGAITDAMKLFAPPLPVSRRM